MPEVSDVKKCKLGKYYKKSQKEEKKLSKIVHYLRSLCYNVFIPKT